MKSDRRLLVTAAIAGALTFTLGAAGAQTASGYPSKPISVVVSYPPGGDTDAIARLFADKLSQRLKQPVIIENKPGAGGALGNNYVGRAPADGYTLLFTPNPFTTAPLVMKLSPSASYDVLHGFEPIIKTAVQPLVLVANPAAGVKSVPEMIASVKGGKALSYASPGAGSPMHILGEWLNRAAGVKITHVPYRGVGPSVTDVVAGHVDTAWVTFGPVTQYIQQGRLVPLAIGDAQRSRLAPNVPTLVEAGYKDVVVGAWNGFFAPKGTPAEVVKLLNTHLNEILKSPEVVEKLATFGALPVGGAPELLGKTNASDYEVMGKVIRDLGVSAE
ncbi:Bug family tripartite tricarboxylate transporter substrate binding protein [Variovorax saccharolyticus]|uniref:Bug family tripartite tricarboxylate transporter substrate binding protein n=1 Tax=Variovorax saccharolyticus TaxID=3053516 RepID=UPI002576BEED|nr:MULTISPECIES: tripartite tricarboxylate transporter substrate binding protein [unclassified Variovorax]MDM0019619.1 tripartite tricarboxylate transporter substrate binding protein [Variovorax sp. J22R187]MDM0027759.1 tripartite tricarboxylate transporter substrate binding protein [Variovorax sp. J31P216]